MAESINLKTSSATLRNLKTSPQKLNLVAGLIRGRSAALALDILMFNQKRNAAPVRKLLMSAIANAENNNGLDVDELIVDRVLVGKGMRLRRFHARGRGRSASVQKHYSNVTIVVRERDTAAIIEGE
jgi:large subunit ribosomal protein L22